MDKRPNIQLIYPKHNFGYLADRENINLPPPLGILTLASYLEKEVPKINIECFDGNRISDEKLISNIDSDIVGISTVFSNYYSGICLAKKLKTINPKCTIIFGGPGVNGIETKILKNNQYINYVFSGESELGLSDFIKGFDKQLIPGLWYRDGNCIKNNKNIEIKDLDKIPLITFDTLKTSYNWIEDVANNSAFPISGIRGCLKKNRCEYCSLPSISYRSLSPNKYWERIQYFSKTYGINRFFETGDTFNTLFAKQLSYNKPKSGPFPKLRIYSYPGLINENNIHYYLDIGVDNVFIGIESILVWGENGTSNRKRGKTIDIIFKELELLSNNGIKVMPSFILGLPGETTDTLTKNIEIISTISKIKGVKEYLINSPFPLPNSEYFDWCTKSSEIVNKYYKITGFDLRKIDHIDYHLLSKLFVEQFTTVSYKSITDTIKQLESQFQNQIASFGLLNNEKEKNHQLRYLNYK